MKKTIKFAKISAAGNDFILVDNRKKVVPRDVSSLARKWCHRKFSIGADGLMLLEESPKVDFRMRFYNSDGSVAAMCGNGGRSIARFAHILGVAGKHMVFESDAGLISASMVGKNVRLRLSEPKDARLDFTLKVEKKEFAASFINTGVPHTVIFVNDIEKADVDTLGRMVRYHREFAPQGTNVNFVEKKDAHSIYVRTYERGVEGETLACGTGVTASAIISALRGIIKPPVNCLTRGGDVLKVSFTLNHEGDLLSPVSSVYLEGPAEVSFWGEAQV
ncbi:MAG: diaminopimelate epimerase [Elusimicrobia bacterium RIFOXYA1_FULL_47_7]|nr:MAG: diaminopimelate epimerase [Elusimicrobia bacterium RIFOXYA12_FULL_49_49]OGS09227.1 MAG: diaminopimelate epimerase [Elusimicrobia bacterium RIFOXYA1_FULL_47_7]OGS10036.1 MAG: diaminopimelate epimerase [Elusimicrobia bacterium RIFOXYB1_FULL_48_9]OGS16313.1 MAG: diaminopimelate epimerase [Elusimicrobia bacterium RIFOXYA2_FULL_47_53]OGS26593.1 MAG: diaminopimelate epimerase [Elusimicrobia bacterium RIFOXYB12_FULL_50_12]OGS31362.1 MAG: diaminopimelate epimerase [Elusimicrobia bacterium RIFO